MTAQQANWDKSLLPQQPGGETKQSANTHPARPARPRVPDAHFCTQPANQSTRETPKIVHDCPLLPHTRARAGVAVRCQTHPMLRWHGALSPTKGCDLGTAGRGGDTARVCRRSQSGNGTLSSQVEEGGYLG